MNESARGRVVALADEGLFLRAIARKIRVSHETMRTVLREINAGAEVALEAVGDSRRTGLDGKAGVVPLRPVGARMPQADDRRLSGRSRVNRV
jgi:hypothetical protein